MIGSGMLNDEKRVACLDSAWRLNAGGRVRIEFFTQS
jgi:hypothetical protein